MKIIELSYAHHSLSLEGLQLGTTNLLVGQNATGKSRTLNVIDKFVNIITQRAPLNRLSGMYAITFLDDRENKIHYYLDINTFQENDNEEEKTWIKETIELNGSQLLHRDATLPICTIYNQLNQQTEEIYPPDNKLVIHTNRDTKKYPFLEKIAIWAEHSFGFKFSNIAPQYHLGGLDFDFLTPVENIPALYLSLKKEDQTKVLEAINAMGYDLYAIEAIEKERPILTVREAKTIMPHTSLSQGLFRALAMIIYVEYLVSRRKPATILIDDLCEGLDYARAIQLGKYLFKTCKEHDIQLIATSNDSFLMDAVDIEDLNVLHREGKKITSINYYNHPELFDNFRFTGLSNFDFFSSNYLASKK